MTSITIDTELKKYAKDRNISITQLVEDELYRRIKNENAAMDINSDKTEGAYKFDEEMLIAVAKMNIINRPQLKKDFQIVDDNVLNELIIEAIKYKIMHH
jgi:galactitol-specific phosphotransferase system IIB component